MEEGEDFIKGHYIHVWKYHSETHLKQLIYAYANKIN
jgi:hypothetical protein